MKVIKAVVITLFFVISSMASSLVITSDITTNTTWNTDTIIIDKNDFTVQSGFRLIIAPGTEVKIRKSFGFITVKGAITAIGTESDSIRFSHENANIVWQGVRFLKRNQGTVKKDSSFIKYCNLSGTEYVEGDSLYIRTGGVLYCGPGNYVELSNSVLHKNRGSYGGAVYGDSGSTVHIDNCNFISNTADFYGGGAIMTSDKGSSDLLVENCRFEYNYALNGGAVWIGKGTKAEFNNCVFYKDTTYSINPESNHLNGGALAIFNHSDVTMRNCLIFYCRSYGKGGGIYSADASLKLINCTIASNYSVYGGGIYFARDSVASSPLLVNTIEGGNGTLYSLPRDSAGCGIYLDSSVTPILHYCQMYDTVHDYKIKPYTGEFTNSRYYHTEFVCFGPGYDVSDTVAEGYQLYSLLSFKDPAIDGGTPDTTGLGLPEFDLAGNKRINGKAIDIGALEHYDPSSVSKPFSQVRKEQSFSSGPCDAVIYSLNGRKMGSFRAKIYSQSVQKFVESKFPQGIYLVTLSRAGKQVWSKRVFVR